MRIGWSSVQMLSKVQAAQYRECWNCIRCIRCITTTILLLNCIRLFCCVHHCFWYTNKSVLNKNQGVEVQAKFVTASIFEAKVCH